MFWSAGGGARGASGAGRSEGRPRGGAGGRGVAPRSRFRSRSRRRVPGADWIFSASAQSWVRRLPASSCDRTGSGLASVGPSGKSRLRRLPVLRFGFCKNVGWFWLDSKQRRWSRRYPGSQRLYENRQLGKAPGGGCPGESRRHSGVRERLTSVGRSIPWAAAVPA